MKAIALASLVSLLACQSKAKEEPEAATVQPTREVAEEPEAAPPKMAAALPKTAVELDLDRICNVEELSGALELPSGDRALHTGIWLAKTIETQEIRDFVAELTALDPAPRIQRMQAKLDEHKISPCEILNTWGG